MGKKKGKNTKQQEEDWGDETAAQKVLEGLDEDDINPVGPAKGPKGGGGKKSKRKRSLLEDYDIEAEMGEISEKGSEEPDSSTRQSLESPADQITSEKTSRKAKPSRKKEKPQDTGCDDDIVQQVASLSLEESTVPYHHCQQQEEEVAVAAVSTTGKSSSADEDKAAGKRGKKARKAKKEMDSEEIDQLLQEIEEGAPIQPKPVPSNALATTDTQDGTDKEMTTASDTPPSKHVSEPVKEEFHVKSKGEKKKEKKLKRKQEENSKAKAQQQQELQQHQEEVQIPPQPPKPETGQEDQEEVTEKAGDVKDPGDGEKVEDKKKKKKDKSAKDDKKGGAKVTKKKTAIQKMKEEIEALRMAQKKREEEELARLKAEEEAEQKRQEQIRLEQERKERKKQKEKEKRERLRAEGKLLTRSEKERRAKTEAQLAALKESGVIVPEKKLDDSTAEKRKPVRYGIRVRPKKKKQLSQEVEEEAVKEMTETQSTAECDEMVHDSGGDDVEEEKVKDNWDDEDEQQSVKDNWDDETDDEEDLKSVSQCSVASTPSNTQPQAVDSEGNAGESEAESESENSDSGEESEEEEEEEEDESLTPYDRAARRIKEYRIRCQEERSLDLLRSPVVCVLGHVDTGKTKILDKIRHTHVQDGEAGGITQQIGATFVPDHSVREQTKMLKEFQKVEIKLPGLLIIDTPGHESFSNLRTRGSSMCDIAILVVDIMHGLEPQTIESLNLLLKGKTPFIVALNKIDRLFDWRRNPNSGVRENIKRQKQNTKDEFEERTRDVVTQFAEQGINAALFWEKVNFTEYVPMVPTSAITGDGMGDLIAMVVTYSQKMLAEKLMFSKDLEAIVMEVKVIAGLGTTIDVILRNGILNEGDTLVLTSSEGPFVTQARALLMPQALRELRVKNAYINHKVVIASQGVKICAKELEKTLAGTPLLVAKRPDEIDVLKDEAASMMSSALSSFKLSERGVFVQASTLGSLEALIDFLVHSKIPYAGVNIGPVHKKDVMKASVMLERDSQWAVILAFDVRVEREAQELADSLGVKIFTADIIYHLFDNFIKHREELRERKRREFEHIAVFPCKLRILPNCVFNARNPIVMGVQVEAGVVKPGTPITVPTKNFTDLGIITSLEINHKPVDIVRKGAEVCIKIEPSPGEAPKLYGRHFDLEDTLVSKITRESINAVKNYFREDLQKADWQLMVQLKKVFQIM